MARPVADPFRLRVTDLPPEGWLTYESKGLLLGSCFATEIGARLERDGFQVTVNPYGTAFNPITTLQSLTLSWEQVERGLVERDGGFTSHLLHSDVWGNTVEELKSAFEQRRTSLLMALKEMNWLSLTLGTAWVYERKADGLLCANLHKRPAVEFCRRLVGVEEIVAAWLSALSQIQSSVSRIVVTVSPVIHGRDGLAQNSLSKAVLRVAAEEMTHRGRATYFPSLEIVRDELRDYRFYAEDMQHPSSQAVDVVYDRFLAYALNVNERKTLEQYRSLVAFANHRPGRVDKELYRTRLAELEGLAVPEAAKGRVREKLEAVLDR